MKKQVKYLTSNNFPYADISIKYYKSTDSITLCCEYSDKPDELKELLRELKVKIRPKGIGKYFDNDNEARQVIEVYLKRGNTEISFPFGMSINDTNILRNPGVHYDIVVNKTHYTPTQLRQAKERIIAHLLYDILACCASDYMYDDQYDFNDWCGDYGYDSSSIKAKKIFESCIEHNVKLKQIFGESDIECLPR